MNRVKINVDAEKRVGMLPHSWNYIGYDEVNYTYTPEGKELLGKFTAIQEKPYYVRAHHLLCTGNCHGFYKWGSSNAYIEDDQGNPIYNWMIVDMVFDTIIQNGMKPFVEIGFMPQDLADMSKYVSEIENFRMDTYRTFGWRCPPKDYQKWHDLVYQLVRHQVEKYGVDEVKTWYWELWNEADAKFYWLGTVEEFNKLYDYTAAAVKAACPEARVGGPATTRPLNPGSSEFLDAFLDHCLNGINAVTGKKGTPLDYVSYHVKGGRYAADPKNRPVNPPSVKHLMTNVLTGYKVLEKYPGVLDMECVLSEFDPDGWAAGGAWDNAGLNFRNTEYYATYVLCTIDKLIRFGKERHWDVRPLTWAFLFVGERCFEGTRTFSTQGINKAVFNLFKMLSMMGDDQVYFSSSAEKNPFEYADLWGKGVEPDISGFATRKNNNQVEVLLYSHHDDWDLHDEAEVEVELNAPEFAGKSIQLTHYRIDENHSNAYAEWERQGKPMYPSAEQYAAIKARDGLELYEPVRTMRVESSIRMKLKMPERSISLLVFEPQ
jgi:xylan 1,4-beta-xylosidase